MVIAPIIINIIPIKRIMPHVEVPNGDVIHIPFNVITIPVLNMIKPAIVFDINISRRYNALFFAIPNL